MLLFAIVLAVSTIMSVIELYKTRKLKPNQMLHRTDIGRSVSQSIEPQNLKSGGTVMNIAKRALFTAILSAAIVTHSGTIAFKDGATLSEVEIVSIKDGEIKIRKDKKERTFKLNTISSFYSADTGSDSGEIPGDFADYKITIDDVKMPNKGEDTKGKDEKCVVSYIITRTDSKKDKIKVPYFYLYVLSSPAPDDSDGERGRYSYYYPDNAKPKGKSKGYDEAAISL